MLSSFERDALIKRLRRTVSSVSASILKRIKYRDVKNALVRDTGFGDGGPFWPGNMARARVVNAKNENRQKQIASDNRRII